MGERLLRKDRPPDAPERKARWGYEEESGRGALPGEAGRH